MHVRHGCGWRLVRSTVLAIALLGASFDRALAQAPQLVFTVTPPDVSQAPTTTVTRLSAVVEERGLVLWSGAASDFGVGVTVSTPHWTVRSITSMTTLPLDGRDRPTFQQFEIVRPLLASDRAAVAGGAGMRYEWDGTNVLIGRVMAGFDLGPGRLQGSLVFERAMSSTTRHDAADLVTTIGWSKPITDRVGFGVEGIGQDLEGFWDPAEADGGAKLLVGPSLHAESHSGKWSASLTVGPVINTQSSHHLGIFASASWVPSLGR